MRIAILILVTAASALSITGLARAESACHATPDPQDDSASVERQRIDAAMPHLLTRYQVPGAAVALVRDGMPDFSRGYGWAIPPQENGTPGVAVDAASTLFQAASISKPVAALTVLSLVHQGRVALDRPIMPQVRESAGAWQLPASDFDSNAVTVARVLSHTAGLSVPGYGGFPPGTPAQSLLDSLKAAADADDTPLEVVMPPGQAFRYSGGGYSLLELLIHDQAGEPFADAAAHRIFNPLGMTRSHFPAAPASSPPLATSFDDQGRPAPARHFTALAAAGLQTTADDLARLLAVLMPGPCGEEPGRGLLPPELIQRLLTPMPQSDNDLGLGGSRYGLGMALTLLDSGRQLAYHPGDNLPNWHNLIAAIPERRAGLVVMTNAAGGQALRDHLLCIWLDALGESHPALNASDDCATTEVE